MINRKYFVSYTMVKSDGTHGFGNVTLKTNTKIDDFEKFNLLVEGAEINFYNQTGLKPGVDVGPLIILSFQEL